MTVRDTIAPGFAEGLLASIAYAARCFAAWQNSAIVATTTRCSFAVSSGKIGKAIVSAAARSLSGRLPAS